jgi:hypothetical protein
MDIIHKLYALSKSYDKLKEHKFLIDEQEVIDKNILPIIPSCPDVIANLMLTALKKA